VSRIIPDYRSAAFIDLPTRMGERAGIALAKGLNSWAVMFNPYHQGVLRGLRNMTITPGKGLPNLVRAADRIAAMGFLMMVLQPAAAHLVQSVLNNKRAHVRRAGFTMVPYHASLVAHGLESPERALTSVVTPSPAATGVLESVTNRRLISGQPVSTFDPHHPLRSLEERAKAVVPDIIAPIRVATGLVGAPLTTVSQYLGVSTPKFTPLEARLIFDDRSLVQAREGEIRKLIAQGKPQEARRLWNEVSREVLHDLQEMVADDRRRGINPIQVLGEAPDAWWAKHRPKWPGEATIERLRRQYRR